MKVVLYNTTRHFRGLLSTFLSYVVHSPAQKLALPSLHLISAAVVGIPERSVVPALPSPIPPTAASVALLFVASFPLLFVSFLPIE